MKKILSIIFLLNFIYTNALDKKIVKAIYSSDFEYIAKNFPQNVNDKDLFTYKILSKVQAKKFKNSYLIKKSRSLKDWAAIVLGTCVFCASLKIAYENLIKYMEVYSLCQEGLPQLAFPYETREQRSVFTIDPAFLPQGPLHGYLNGLGSAVIAGLFATIGLKKYFSQERFNNSVAIKNLICKNNESENK
ncbi:hypothetical protein M1446_04935 [Candidatus Dependentiae bacterium]|nr:hypothetical protein [Candidatus Dependentiae bacterium]